MLALDHVARAKLEQTVGQAIQLVTPQIKRFMETGITEHRQACSIVIAYRGFPWENGSAILIEEDVNEPEPEKRKIARSKAHLSHRRNLPTCDIELHERQAGDTQYWGSVVASPIGLVVAISGLQPWYDELFSWWIEAAVIALLKDAGLIYRSPDWDPDQPAFLTEEHLKQLRLEEHERIIRDPDALKPGGSRNWPNQVG